ncbi:hypothetical protein HDU91_004853 [Kappamyces sp. JEL0680]|nr:hypothetical protein HDU91_004853 [Kappamyces sp. JEL0680]
MIESLLRYLGWLVLLSATLPADLQTPPSLPRNGVPSLLFTALNQITSETDYRFTVVESMLLQNTSFVFELSSADALTFLAPTDDAFQAYNWSLQSYSNRSLLHYHTVMKQILFKEIQLNGQSVFTTLGGSDVKLGRTSNNSIHVVSGYETTSTVLHWAGKLSVEILVLDRVLEIPRPLSETLPLFGWHNFSYLWDRCKDLEESSLRSILDTHNGTLTAFAPTDQAWSHYWNVSGTTIDTVDNHTIAALVERHLLLWPSPRYHRTLLGNYTMVGGDTFAFQPWNGSVIVQSYNNSHSVLGSLQPPQWDILAYEGAIHAIDAVLEVP